MNCHGPHLYIHKDFHHVVHVLGLNVLNCTCRGVKKVFIQLENLTVQEEEMQDLCVRIHLSVFHKLWLHLFQRSLFPCENSHYFPYSQFERGN